MNMHKANMHTALMTIVVFETVLEALAGVVAGATAMAGKIEIT